MDLEVIGRHALLFDDDTAAAFVNSDDALVDWHALKIDRYDVRHLLSAPPPSRRLTRKSEPIISYEESELDHERYLDLPPASDQPDIEDDDEKQPDPVGYRAVAFSYGNTDDSSDQKNTDVGMETSRFLPPFPVPENLLQSLPPTEKVHQIIARTAFFVSKHGGQSEIVLRVKQGDNPTFGFLMPGHQLHAYFRFLVEHPELHSEMDGKSQDEGKKAGCDHYNSNSVAGSLSLLGSIYGSGEEEEGDHTAITEQDSQDETNALNPTIPDVSKKIESLANAAKGESVSKNQILSNKEKVLSVKKNSLITISKSGSVKRKEEKSSSFSAALDKAKSTVIGGTSKPEPLIIEPPTELKRLIDRIVEFILRNGKQFEATLIEQDSKHGKFPFLLPSNQYHSYYLKVLQSAQESKSNGKSSYSTKDDAVVREIGKKASTLKEKDYSNIPLESDRKEKFKMVIGKSKKEAQETKHKGMHQESGISVDAAAAAAILHAATRGIKNSGIVSRTSSSPPSGPDNAAAAKSDLNDSRGASKTIANTVALEAAGEADSSEAHLTKEQKLKAERLKRAKMFVAVLKSGAAPVRTGTSRGSSVEPGVSMSAGEVNLGEVNLDSKERESSLAPVDIKRSSTGEKPETNYFGEEHTEKHAKRKYRSRSEAYGEEDEEEDVGDAEEDDKKRHSRRKHKSRSRHYDDDEREGENDDAIKREQKHSRRRHQSHSSSDETNDERGDEYKEDKHHKRARKTRRSRHSSRERSSKRHLSKKYSDEEDESHDDDEGRGHRHSRKKHRSHRSSHRSRDKRRHRNRHSSRDTESRRDYKGDRSSNDGNKDSSYLDKHKSGERDKLEEGEISSRVSEESRGLASGRISREGSAGVMSFPQRASSQPVETTTEVPDDLRAKIRAMLMANRL